MITEQVRNDIIAELVRRAESDAEHWRFGQVSGLGDTPHSRAYAEAAARLRADPAELLAAVDGLIKKPDSTERMFALVNAFVRFKDKRERK